MANIKNKRFKVEWDPVLHSYWLKCIGTLGNRRAGMAMVVRQWHVDQTGFCSALRSAKRRLMLKMEAWDPKPVREADFYQNR